jgi:DtxR family Mn-dependent transcriptional regulator
MRKRTIEEYLEIVYMIQIKNKKVHTTNVASALHVNPASVTEMFQKLSTEGYINYEKYSGVTLTQKGKKIAILTKKKHDTLKKFLMILGIDETIADTDACKIEHSVHTETMRKLRKFVEFANLDNVCSRWLDHYKEFVQHGTIPVCRFKNLK